MTKQSRRYLAFGIKLTLVILAFWFIIKKVIRNRDLVQFRQFLEEMPSSEVWLLFSILLSFMFLNWGIEVFKWKRLMHMVERISLSRSFQSVFCGLTLAIFTPNRIGEYGGRVFFLSPKRRIVGVVAMAVGNIGQMVVTNVFGLIALLFFLYRFTQLDDWIFTIVCIAVLSILIVLCVFYFNIRIVKGILLYFKWSRKYSKFYSILGRYSKLELFKLLLLSIARYVVFSTQYVIIIKWLIPELGIYDILMMVSILFFIQSSMPSLALFDIGLRSLAATHFFGYITDQQTAIVASAACIWMINIVIPAILGSYFVFKLRFFGNSDK